MAKTCLRTAATQIQNLLSANGNVTTPDGRRIIGAEAPIQKASQRGVQLILKLEDGTKQVIIAGEPLKGGGWVVEHPLHVASYLCEMSGQELRIIAQPKAYLPDHFVQLNDINGKKKKKPVLAISGDFNGGISVTTKSGQEIHVHGWSCKNHPPAGYQLYSSWGTIPGAIPLQMEFALVKENPQDFSPEKRKKAA